MFAAGNKIYLRRRTAAGGALAGKGRGGDYISTEPASSIGRPLYANQLRTVGSCRREEEWLRAARAAALSLRRRSDCCSSLSLCKAVELS